MGHCGVRHHRLSYRVDNAPQPIGAPSTYPSTYRLTIGDTHEQQSTPRAPQESDLGRSIDVLLKIGLVIAFPRVEVDCASTGRSLPPRISSPNTCT